MNNTLGLPNNTLGLPNNTLGLPNNTLGLPNNMLWLPNNTLAATVNEPCISFKSRLFAGHLSCCTVFATSITSVLLAV